MTERLEQIRACEDFLKEKGFHKFRIGCHDHLVRLEVAPEEIQRFFDHTMREVIVRRFQEIGFHFVSLDLQGYRTEGFNPDSKASKERPS